MKKLGFGFMRLPLKADGAIDNETLCSMVDYYLEHGFTYFDTSYVYHGGRSETAIRETTDKYGRRLRSLAYGIVEDLHTAEECENDTYMEAWNAIPPHRPDSLAAFLCKLNRRISIDLLRKRESLKRGGSQYMLSLSELSECLPGGEDTEQAVDGKLLAAAITEFVRRLPEKNRRVFLGRYYFLDSVQEVAGYCGMTQANVKTILHRTRIALREYLEQEGFL